MTHLYTIGPILGQILSKTSRDFSKIFLNLQANLENFKILTHS